MHAIIHTKGVVLNNIYVPLELAYCDVTGYFYHFHITSPLNYSEMRRQYGPVRPDVQVSVTSGTRYLDVLQFLRNRYDILQTLYPKDQIFFGYKGEKYQPKVLKDAEIPHIVNVETLGVPPLKEIKITDNFAFSCPLHKGRLDKCALLALRRILSYFQ